MKARTSFAAVVAIGAMGFAGAAQAHTSPEYFVDPVALGQMVGHRHHITQVSVRNTGDYAQFGVGALNDADQHVNVAWPYLSNNQVHARNYAGTTWYRGYSYTHYTQLYRAQEQF